MRASPRNSASTLALFLLLVTVEARAADRAWSVSGSPVAIAATAGRVYVADFDNDRVEAFTRGGAPIGAWGGSGSEAGQFHGPTGIAIGSEGSVLVTDLYNHRVQRFGPDGTFIASWTVGEQASPFGVAVDGRGRIYVTDLDAGRVSVWSGDGAAIASWGTRGRGHGELEQPWGIAVDGQGDVLVVDHGNDRVQRFSGDGEWLGEWGSGVADFAGPMGIAVGRDGSVYVSDLAGDPLQRFARNGERMALSGAADPGLVGAGLALDAGGDVLLADAMGRQVVRVAGAGIVSPGPAPTAFAMLPIAQPLGRGPITLDFAISGPGTIGADFYSLDGRRVHTVADAACEAGTTRITWDAVADDGHRAPVGIYFVRVHFQDGVSQISRSGRVVVLR
jgi:DNA-binding beta-propeller fold protein YncE